MSGGTPARQFALTLVACVAGAGLIILALRPAWAHAVFTAPHPLPAQDIPVSGQQLVPLASALALAALACLAAVIATRSWPRRVAGVVLAALGAGGDRRGRSHRRLGGARGGPGAGRVRLAGRVDHQRDHLGRYRARADHRGRGRARGHDGHALAGGRDLRRGRDRPDGPGHRVARPALAGDVGPVRPPGGVGGDGQSPQDRGIPGGRPPGLAQPARASADSASCGSR